MLLADWLTEMDQLLDDRRMSYSSIVWNYRSSNTPTPFPWINPHKILNMLWVEESIIERCGLKQKDLWRNGKMAKWEYGAIWERWRIGKWRNGKF
jgi:hypothetical protein